MEDSHALDLFFGVIANAVFDLARHLSQGDKAATDRIRFEAGARPDRNELRQAIEGSVARLTEVPEVEERLGGETLVEFLRSPEVASIVQQLFVIELAPSSESSVDSIREEFTLEMGLWTGISQEELDEEGSRIFDALVSGCQQALAFAISRNILEAHEANETLRFRLLSDHLANIEKSLEEFKNYSPASVEEILAFEESYRLQVADRESFIVPPNLDRRDKKPIDDLFVPTRIRSSTPGEEPLQYEEFLQVLHRGVLLGDPGGGKSTMAAKLCHDLATRYDERPLRGLPLTPVLIVLRDFGAAKKKSAISIREFIEENARSKYQLDIPSGAFDYLFRTRRVLIIFDGLDELLDTTYRQEISADVESFAALYSAVPILVTSRRIGYEQAPLDRDRFPTFRLANFDDDQVREYASKWFRLDSALPQAERELRVEAFLHESQVVPDLRANPLMLGLMCNIYQGENYIPANRPDVYAKCAVMLFERWDKGRSIEIDLPFESLFRPAMQFLAHWIHESEDLQVGVTREKLIQQTTSYLHPRRFEDEDEAREAAQRFVDLCKGRAWVFTDTGSLANGDLLYGFTHRTFLEYFTADYLARTNPTTEALLEVLANRIARQEWDVVSQLAVQIHTKYVEDAADKVLELLLTQIEAESGSRRTNVVTFAARSLEFLVPSPKRIREVVHTALDEIQTAQKRSVDSSEPADIDLDLERNSEALAILEALVGSGSETRPTVGKAIKDLIVTDVRSGRAGSDVALLLEIGLHLSLAVKGRARGKGSDAIRLWVELSEDLTSECKDALVDLAQQDPMFAVDAVTRGCMTPAEAVELFDTSVLFRVRTYEVFQNVHSIPIALFALFGSLIAPNNEFWEGRYERCSSDLLEIGDLLLASNPPWVTASHESIWGGWLSPSFPHGETLTPKVGPESLGMGLLIAVVILELNETRLDATYSARAREEGSEFWLALADLVDALNANEGADPAQDVFLPAGIPVAVRDLLRAWTQGKVEFTRRTTSAT